jgi:hypothetical protein
VSQTGSAYVRGKKVKPDALLSITDFTIVDDFITNGKKTIKNNAISADGVQYSFEV